MELNASRINAANNRYGYYLNPCLHDGTEHELLIPPQFKKSRLDLWMKTGFFNSIVKPASYILHRPEDTDSGNK